MCRNRSHCTAPRSGIHRPRYSRFFILPPVVMFFDMKSSRSIFLYSSKEPSKTVTEPGISLLGPGMTTHNSSATMETSLSSWLTRTTPPSNLFSAMARPSIVSRSRWFVGSSKSMMWGADQASSAKASRLFCPPLRFFTGFSARSPWRPNRPRYFRASSTVTSLVPSARMPPAPRRRMWTTASWSGSIISMWCCVKRASDSLECLLTAPSVGCREPSSSFRKVDLPAPFGPTMATRESQSTPKFRPWYRILSSV
mmetsp:Transcript_2036/g.6501  ORF Transcript_2036/g.6501 Transcript_2036/m.6501 type:complete len:254 (-) Transcript_2036:379-1140(-)